METFLGRMATSHPVTRSIAAMVLHDLVPNLIFFLIPPIFSSPLMHIKASLDNATSKEIAFLTHGALPLLLKVLFMVLRTSVSVSFPTYTPFWATSEQGIVSLLCYYSRDAVPQELGPCWVFRSG